MQFKSKKFVANIPIILSAMILASCSTADSQSSGQSDNLRLVSFAAMTTEYNESQKAFPLPAGKLYPDISTFNLQVDGTFQEGFGEGQAVYIWNCSWAAAYLEVPDKSSPEASKALDEYASLEKTESFQKNWDEESAKSPFRTRVENARLGDSSGIQKEVQINCPGGDPRL